jgi:hypothetical protein
MRSKLIRFTTFFLANLAALCGAGLMGLVGCAPSLHESSALTNGQSVNGVVGADQIIAPFSSEGQSTVLIIIVEKVAGGLMMRRTCTGSIIAKDLIVTAAHCLSKDKQSLARKASTVIVYFGPYHDGQSLKNARAVAAAQVKIHPKFSNAWRIGDDSFDVGLIRLSGPLFPGYEPARILASNFALLAGQRVIIAGHGNPKYNGAYSDEILRGFSDYKIEDHSAPFGSTLTLRSLSVGGISDGDSGGPGFVAINGNTFLWGIASSADTGGFGRAFYVDLRRFETWILRAASQMGSPFILIK